MKITDIKVKDINKKLFKTIKSFRSYVKSSNIKLNMRDYRLMNKNTFVEHINKIKLKENEEIKNAQDKKVQNKKINDIINTYERKILTEHIKKTALYKPMKEETIKKFLRNYREVVNRNQTIKYKQSIPTYANYETDLYKLVDNQLLKYINEDNYKNFFTMIKQINNEHQNVQRLLVNVRVISYKIPYEIKQNIFSDENINIENYTFNGVTTSTFEIKNNMINLLSSKNVNDIRLIKNAISLDNIGNGEYNELIENFILSFIPIKYNHGMVYFIDEFYISITNDFNDKNNMNNYIKKLKAFSPAVGYSYHKNTICSTTKDRYCIYETYYYLYIDKVLINKNKETIMNAFYKESPQIQKAVKNGELYNFLKLKNKETKQVYYVKFFKALHGTCFGFKVDEGKISILASEMAFADKDVFLYWNKHVAPSRQDYKNKIENIMKSRNIENTDYNYNNILTNLIKSKERNKTKFFQMTPQKLIKDVNIQNVYSLDYECYLNEYNEFIPYAASLYSKTDNQFFYNNTSDITNQIIDYLDTVITVTNMNKTNAKKKVPLIYIWTFNGANFDNRYLLLKLLKRNPSTKYILANNSIKTIKYHNIRFMDLKLFYAGSLKSVAKACSLDISKGVFPYKFPNCNNLNYKGNIPELKYWNNEDDYNKYIKNELPEQLKLTGYEFDLKEYTKKYCILDTRLTLDIALLHMNETHGTILIKGKEKKYNCVNSCTGAGLAVNMFKQLFLNDTLISSPKYIQEYERKAYKGGRTEVFKKYFGPKCVSYKKTHRLYYMDINSSYPASMLEEMPFQFNDAVESQSGYELNKNNIIETNLYEVTYKYSDNLPNDFIPNLLMRSDKGDIIATLGSNTIKSTHWGIELLRAIKDDPNIKITCYLEITYSRKAIFKEFSEYFYNERLKIKKTNKAKAQFYKLLLNSLYGKFASKSFLKHVLVEDETEELMILGDNKNKICSYKNIDKEYNLISYQTEDNDGHDIGNLVRFSSYIAAVSRTNLANAMSNVGHNNIYYCDTDSIFTSKQLDDSFLSQTELGKWKIEETSFKYYNTKDEKVKATVLGIIKEAYFIAPKCYKYIIDEKQPMIKDYKSSICDYVQHAKGQRESDLTKITTQDKEFWEKIYKGEKIEIMNPTLFKSTLNNIKCISQGRSMRKVLNKRIWNNIDDNSKPYTSYEEWYSNKY